MKIFVNFFFSLISSFFLIISGEVLAPKSVGDFDEKEEKISNKYTTREKVKTVFLESTVSAREIDQANDTSNISGGGLQPVFSFSSLVQIPVQLSHIFMASPIIKSGLYLLFCEIKIPTRK